ncbi:MAG: hypothetical protein WAV05_10435 [Anaerolineales bacterium]
MDNELTSKRWLVIALVVVTIIIFVGLVWLIATFVPWNRLGFQSPSATASAQVAADCTYPISYWKEHPELYPPQMVIGGVVYTERELEALLSEDDENPIQQIRAQLAVAFLNISDGADQSVIEATIFNAYEWLVNHPAGSQITDDDQETGRRLFNLLESYNLGLAGVKPCEATIEITRTETSTVTETPTLLFSSTPGQTTTPTASETPTPTSLLITPILTTGVPGQPTFTASPVVIITTVAPSPTRTPPKITSTFTRSPSPTVIITTVAPSPTRTPPPSSPTFTQPPPPTITPTLPPP